MTAGTAVTTWDNDGQWVRHRATSKTPSPFPGRLDITLLMLAFLLKRISLKTSSIKRTMLSNGESVWLWTRFVVRFYLPKAPAVARTIVVNFVIVIQKESVHTNIRRLAVTAMYSVGAVTVIALAPKVIILVWSV